MYQRRNSPSSACSFLGSGRCDDFSQANVGRESAKKGMTAEENCVGNDAA
jgi:hypothetical protein